MTSADDDAWPSVARLLALLGIGDDADSRPTIHDLERVVRVLADVEVDDAGDAREHVFEASTRLAQVAIGRESTDDESWDDVVQLIEEDNQSSLASALWVGLSSQPEARFRSREQWTRSVEAGMRSDAATAEMVARRSSGRSPARRLLLAALALVAVVGVGAVVGLAGSTFFGAQPAEPDTTQAEGDGIESGSGLDGPETATSDADPEGPEATDGQQPSDETASQPAATATNTAADGDDCGAVGPLGPLFVDQVTDRSIVIGWQPSTEAVNIFLDGGFVDTVPPDTNQYVIENRPLLPPPLPADTNFKVEVATETAITDGNADGQGVSSACAATAADPVSPDQQLIGVYAPTGLLITDESPTSLTVAWDLRPGADIHNLFLNGAYIDYGGGIGSTAVGDEAEFTFVDLEPGAVHEIGVRRIEGFNQSAMAVLTATTPME